MAIEIEREVWHGTAPKGSSRPPRRYRNGRVCRAERCTTVLSTYNPSAFCWQHEPASPYVVRGERRRSA